ncbi:MAG: TIGR02281 family clan AA aspartic protease [Pseudomonadota bacterium]
MEHPTRPAPATGLTRGLRWAPLGIVAFWLVVMAVLYGLMTLALKPPPVTVSANGDLSILRARDGHFYANGTVNGHPVRFLVDTGATTVVVSEAVAQAAGLSGGQATVFRTANGNLPGRVVGNVQVGVGPVQVSGLRVGVGLVGGDSDRALLGQNFLSRFNITLSGDEMVLRGK